jgi:hypothetical protein
VRRAGAAIAALAAAGLAVALMATMTIAGGSWAAQGTGGVPGGAAPSALALAEIPPTYLRLYQAAGARYGLDWAVIAGIGRVECDHGRDPDPSCTREGAVNAAGAGGPMQFLAATWARYGVDAEGDGPPDRWNAADAIYGAANYLRAAGAPGNYKAAIFAYNHAGWYVAEVERWAARYRAPGGLDGSVPGAAAGARGEGAGRAVGEDGSEDGPSGGEEGSDPEGADVRLASETDTPVRFVPGAQALLDPGDGHVALIPAGTPATVQAMVVAGNELQDLPYGPAGHPDPRGASAEDCSSTVNYVLYRAGVRPIAEILAENPLAQEYMHWGDPGPGRWVTIYAADAPTPHVFIVIAGLRLDTSHNGTDNGPNRTEDGPRWRTLPYVPTWAHWSVRHPPGL